MKKNTTESKLVYLGKMKKKMIDALYQCGVLLPENASWQKILNSVAYLKKTFNLGQWEVGDKKMLFRDGMKLPDVEIIDDNVVPNNYNPNYRYPVRIGENMDTSLLDVNSPKYDFNVALAFYFLYIKGEYMSSFSGYVTSAEMYKSNVKQALNNKLYDVANYYREQSTTLNNAGYWNNIRQWQQEPTEKVPNIPYEHNVISYTGPYMFLYTRDRNNQRIYKGNGTFYILYSVYLKADRNINVDWFINTTQKFDLDAIEISAISKIFEVSTEWQRFSVVVSINIKKEHNRYVDIEINPYVQTPHWVKLYFALPYMHFYNNGSTPPEKLPAFNNGQAILDDTIINFISNIINREKQIYLYNYIQKILSIPVSNNDIIFMKKDENIIRLMDEFIEREKSRIFSWTQSFSADTINEINSNAVMIPFKNKKHKVNFKRVFKPRNDRYIPNPMMGYAPYSRWGEYDPEITTLYVDMRWREVYLSHEGNPEEGDLKIRYNLEEWIKNSRLNHKDVSGKSKIFRLILDEPTNEEHCDMPEVMRVEKYGKPYSNSYGKGFAPNYEAIFPHYSTLINYINNDVRQYTGIYQFGILGHWGEWHNNYREGVPKIGDKELMEKYVKEFNKYHFTESLTPPNRIAQLDRWAKYGHIAMMRRPFSIAKENGWGVFNDMIGDKEATKEWLDWIENGGTYDQTPTEENMVVEYKDVFKYGINGGELTSSIPMEDILGKYLEQTIEDIKKSHLRIIGQKIPDKRVNEEAYWKILECIGYRIHIRELKIQSYEEDYTEFFPDLYSLRPNMSYLVSLTLENKGNAFFSGIYEILNLVQPKQAFNFNLNIDNLDENNYYYEDSNNGKTYINLCPGEIKTIRFQISSTDQRGFMSSSFMLKERYSGQPITFDNQEFNDTLPLLHIDNNEDKYETISADEAVDSL